MGLVIEMEETTQKKPHNGPEFIPKLKGLLVLISFHNGALSEGIIMAWNKYEILFLANNTTTPVVLMKNFIASISAKEGTDPFKPKPKEEPKANQDGETNNNPTV
jgi:hypothetical protein